MTRGNKRKDAAMVTSTETDAAGGVVVDKDAVDKDAAGSEDAATPPIIELRGLEKAYGERLVLKGIDMEIRPGTVTCVRRAVKLPNPRPQASGKSPAIAAGRVGSPPQP